MQEKDKSKYPYADIIDLPYKKSNTRPQMSLYDRAAQFSPFAALSGHEDAIEETARLTQSKIDMDEQTQNRLDEQLFYLKSILASKPMLTVTYFQPDDKKEGGAYLTVTNRLKKIDDFLGEFVFEDGIRVNISQIYKIVFNEENEYERTDFGI